MQGNAKKVISESISSLETCIGSLQQSLNAVQNQTKRQKLEQAIDSLNSACEQLSKKFDVRNGID